MGLIAAFRRRQSLLTTEGRYPIEHRARQGGSAALHYSQFVPNTQSFTIVRPVIDCQQRLFISIRGNGLCCSCQGNEISPTARKKTQQRIELHTYGLCGKPQCPSDIQAFQDRKMRILAIDVALRPVPGNLQRCEIKQSSVAPSRLCSLQYRKQHDFHESSEIRCRISL